MWLALIIPPLIRGERPAELETYTTLVIQALDLGIIVPLAAITGTLLLKRDAWGYALASLILIKGFTLGTGVLSMALFMALDGVEIVVPQVIAFAVLTAGRSGAGDGLLRKDEGPGRCRKSGHRIIRRQIA